MFRKVLRSKIHRATVTHADLDYEGSITLPKELLDAANLLEYEAVDVWNITNGNRFSTYTILGENDAESKKNTICVNGAAAHLVTPGDLIIIASFNYLQSDQLADYPPKVVFVDQNNMIKDQRAECPGPQRAA